jgi:hypothetical protein
MSTGKGDSMAHEGKTDNIGKTNSDKKDKSFHGSGVEGQKGAGQGEEETEGAKAPAFDKEGATSVITHRDGPKRVWFRDGKEIGVEDAG